MTEKIIFVNLACVHNRSYSANTKNTIYGVFLKLFAISCVKLKSRYFKPIEKMLSILTKVLTNEKNYSRLDCLPRKFIASKMPKTGGFLIDWFQQIKFTNYV